MWNIQAYLVRFEDLIAANPKFAFTTLSFLMIPVIFLNSAFLQSAFVGFIASLIYFLINAVFLGHAFFRKESSFLRLALGLLMFIMLLGFISWLSMVAWNLDLTRSIAVLAIASALSSIIGFIGKPLQPQAPAPGKGSKQPVSQRSRVISASYLLLLSILLYLLFLSRSGEVSTVWESLNPLFMPIYLATTFLLLAAIFSPGKAEKKLLFILIHSLLSHSLFAAIFPAGDVGAQVLALGRSRLVYENISIDGWPVSLPPTSNILSRIYYWFRGINFQTALSVTFARMLSVDILASHIWLVPVLWGTFIPLAAFLTSKASGFGQRASLLAGLFVSLCPNTIYYGAISVAYSLGLVFFFFSIYFALRFLSNGREALFMLLIFSFFSFLSHFLTGVMSLSMLFVAITLRQYAHEKKGSLSAIKAPLGITLLLCFSLLPLVLVYQKLFFPFFTYFSLSKLSGLPIIDTVSLIFFGGYIYFSVYGAILNIAGTLLGFLVMVHCLRSKSKMQSAGISWLGSFFLFSGFLLAIVNYRILEVFMVGVPFNEERIWLFRDFLAIPFLALLVDKAIGFLHGRAPNVPRSVRVLSSTASKVKVKPSSAIPYILISIALSGWIATCFYYGYPHFAPLQITSYELEAVKHIAETTPEPYVVVADLWMNLAGYAIVGITNPHAFYFSTRDPEGVSLFIEMKFNPANDTLLSAMKHNNATTAYFVIEKPRLGNYTYNLIVFNAQQNGLQTYKVLFYPEGQEKLRIFHYRKPFDNP